MNWIGQQLGNYRLIKLLGKGGFADVYLGEHVHLKDYAAIKVLHTSLAEKEKDGFLVEAQRLKRLKHAHIIRVTDFSITEQGVPFLVLEYAENGTLRDRLPKGSRLSLDQMLPYVKQAASALQYIHDQKLVHRDVKPENMLLGLNDELLLSDIGIAVTAHSEHSLSTQNIVGTPLYMAPEQVRGKPRPASDQYSLGVVVYEWLSGTRPFEDENPIQLMLQHANEPLPPLRNRFPPISPAVEQVVHIALAKDPVQRFANIEAFANALEQANQVERSISSPPPIVNKPDNTPRVDSYANIESSSIPEPVVSLVSLAGPLLQHSQLELDTLPSPSMVNYILQEVGKRARARKLGQ